MTSQMFSYGKQKITFPSHPRAKKEGAKGHWHLLEQSPETDDNKQLNTVKPPCATTLHKCPPTQNTKPFSLKALHLKTLINDHLL